MKWRGRRRSRNIEDRRSLPAGGMKIGGIGAILVIVIGLFLGVDVSPLLNDPRNPGPPRGGGTGALSAEEKAAGEFVAVTLADTEEIWSDIFRRQMGRPYRPAMLVLFSGVTQSPCGGASGATGPFYCPLDRKVYLDTAFFGTLARRMGARGDFAAAYVVAHEVAHHVQDELGILSEATAIRKRLPEAHWARRAHERFGTLEPGDVEEAMNAAKQIGDDTLQRNAGRRPMPHTFTHGTSAQRMRWFRRGFESGDLAGCDTFGARQL